jgi:hypothetical protein
MALPVALLAGPLMDIAGKAFDRIFPDKQAAALAKLELLKLTQQSDFEEWATKADIVKTEAQSDNWLTAAWRPIVMLTLTGLVVARWFGFSAADMSPDEYMMAWKLIQLGLGGYVIGRSAEKILPGVAKAFKK